MATAPRKSSLVLLLLAYLAFATFGLSESLLGIAWPALSTEVGANLDRLGTVVAASMAGLLAMSLLSGRLIGALGSGNVLLGSLLLRMLGLVGFTLVPEPLWLYGVAFVTGLGAGGIAGAANTYVARHHDAGKMGWLHASFGIGATAGPVLLTVLLNRGISWRVGYGAVAGFIFVVAVILLITRRQWPDSAPESVERQVGPPIRATLALPLAWIGILLFLLYRGVEVTASQWTYSLLTEGRGMSALLAGQAASLFWAMLTAGRILLGFVAGRVRTASLLRGATLGATAGTALLLANLSTGANVLAVGLMGLTMASIFPLLSAQTPKRVGAAHTANAVGFQIAGGSLGGALLPALAGELSTTVALDIVAGLMLIGMVAFAVVQELMLHRMRKSQLTAWPKPSS